MIESAAMYDVIVVGAGPGGATAAYFLAQQGIEVLLLDKAAFPRDKTCGDGLLPRALGVFREMGLLPELERISPRIESISAFSPRHREVNAPIVSRDGRPSYALVVPRYRLDQLILDRARAAGAHFVGNAHVVDVQPMEKYSVVTADVEGQRIEHQARLVVVATGASTSLLKTIGLLRKQPASALAVRAYYDDVTGLTNQLELHFSDVALPGYAWIFPTSPTSANIGAGGFPGWRGRPAVPPKSSFHAFLNRNERTRRMLKEAKMAGTVKGYPLRIDFATAPTQGEGVLLVGEAAGLVNPISGDGIDLAAETGQIVAEHIPSLLKADQRSAKALAVYGYDIKGRFRTMFIGLKRLRDLYMNPWLLDRVVSATRKDQELLALIADVALGQADPKQVLTFSRIMQVVRG